MNWHSTTKSVTVASTRAHIAPSADPKIIGRAPTVTNVQFDPLALFGACARCTHLYAVSAALMTPEAVIMQRLIELRVQEAGAAFAVDGSAQQLKDYVRNYFAGTVAAGLAYLAMVEQGYRWFAHFEALVSAGPKSGGSPDFVFGDIGAGVALMEAKGTVSAKSVDFERKVRDGYLGQVEPHLGYAIGGIVATHGYSIGSLMTAPGSTVLSVHYTQPKTVAQTQLQGAGATPSTPLQGGGSGLLKLQQENYATAFSLAHSEFLGTLIRSKASEADDFSLPFWSFKWRGREWVTGSLVGLLEDPLMAALAPTPYWRGAYPIWFAVERNVATSVLRSFTGRESRRTPFGIEGLISEFHFDAAGGDGDGHVFPDGVAAFRGLPPGSQAQKEFWRQGQWDRQSAI